MKTYIICAANHYDDGAEHVHQPKNIKTGFVVCGHRHHNCIMIFSIMVGFPYDEKGRALQDTEIQGFLTNTNEFVDRVEAREIALKAGQLEGRKVHHETKLFSEDLY